jgi:hypothetical protein
VKLNEEELSESDELHVSWSEVPQLGRAAGQNGSSPLGWLEGSEEMGRIASHRRQSGQRKTNATNLEQRRDEGDVHAGRLAKLTMAVYNRF